ncbi:MAG: sialidase family protein [Candidatus Bathyarchaeia archaeon]
MFTSAHGFLNLRDGLTTIMAPLFHTWLLRTMDSTGLTRSKHMGGTAGYGGFAIIGVFYSAAYGWSDPREKHRSFLDLLVSDDGLNWRKHSRIAGEEDKPNEADLLFQGDGELWCIARSGRSPDHSLFYYSKPPYLEWGRIDLKITIHCPVFCKCGDKILVAGRRHMSAQWIPQDTPAGNTGIFVVKAHGAVEPFFALPSCGDAAYPGLISCDRDRIIISYYSQHAYLGGVIDGDISAPLNIADIYVAEIALE